MVRYQLSAGNLPVRAFDSRAQEFSTPLTRRRSSCPPLSPNLVRTHPIEPYQALRDDDPCLSRASTPPEGYQNGAWKRRALANTILSQPNRRRISPDRLNREGSQMAVSLAGEPGPTPAGKTLPHSYPENSPASQLQSRSCPGLRSTSDLFLANGDNNTILKTRRRAP